MRCSHNFMIVCKRDGLLAWNGLRRKRKMNFYFCRFATHSHTHIQITLDTLRWTTFAIFTHVIGQGRAKYDAHIYQTEAIDKLRANVSSFDFLWPHTVQLNSIFFHHLKSYTHFSHVNSFFCSFSYFHRFSWYFTIDSMFPMAKKCYSFAFRINGQATMIINSIENHKTLNDRAKCFTCGIQL